MTYAFQAHGSKNRFQIAILTPHQVPRHPGIRHAPQRQQQRVHHVPPHGQVLGLEELRRSTLVAAGESLNHGGERRRRHHPNRPHQRQRPRRRHAHRRPRPWYIFTHNTRQPTKICLLSTQEARRVQTERLKKKKHVARFFYWRGERLLKTDEVRAGRASKAVF